MVCCFNHRTVVNPLLIDIGMETALFIDLTEILQQYLWPKPNKMVIC